MLNEYKAHVDERAAQNIPPLPLDADQTAQLADLLKSEHEESELLLHLLKERVPAGVDQSAYVKAAFLADITTCLLYTSPSPRDMRRSRMPSSA